MYFEEITEGTDKLFHWPGMLQQHNVMKITDVDTACTEYKQKYQLEIDDFEKDYSGENRKFVGCAINTETNKVSCCYVLVLLAWVCHEMWLKKRRRHWQKFRIILISGTIFQFIYAINVFVLMNFFSVDRILQLLISHII